MKLKAWIIEAPAGGVVMQILEQEGVKPELLTNNVRADQHPEILDPTIYLRGYAATDDQIAINHVRTAQSVIDQITTGLAGHAVSREPKRGDLVEVSDFDDYHNRHEHRIYLNTTEGALYPYRCVDCNYLMRYNKGDKFNTQDWAYMRPIAKPVRYSRAGDVHTWTTGAE